MTDSSTPETRHRERKCLPLEVWPAALQQAWYLAIAPGDAFDPGGHASRWSTASRRKNRNGFGHFLGWASKSADLDIGRPLPDWVTRDLANTYLRHLQETCSGHTIQCRIQELGDSLGALAPEVDWSWINRAAGRLRAGTVPARNKRHRLRPIQDLIALGLALMQEAEQATGSSDLKRAQRYRDGLLLVFTGFHPLRLRNLAELRIGRHMTELGDGYWLALPAPMTKSQQPYEGPAGPVLAAALHPYFEHYRAVILSSDGHRQVPPLDALWVSQEGTALSEERLAAIIGKRTLAAFDVALTPHSFRHSAATTIAVEAPEAVHVIPAVLTHRSEKTYQAYYDLAGNLEASRAHNAALDEKLRRLVKPHYSEERSS